MEQWPQWVQYLPNWGALTGQQLLELAFWGLVGTIARLARVNAPLDIPRRTEDGWRLNVLGEMIMGMAGGIVVNHHPAGAMLGGVLAPWLIQTVLNLDALLRDLDANGSVRGALRAALRTALLGEKNDESNE